MSLKKRNSTSSKKRSGSKKSGGSPAIPKGYKYLGRHDSMHFVMSPTDTVYRGSGDSESGYQVVDDKNLWKKPKGFQPAGTKSKPRTKRVADEQKKTLTVSQAFREQDKKDARHEKARQNYLKKLARTKTHEEVENLIEEAKSMHNIDIQGSGISRKYEIEERLSEARVKKAKEKSRAEAEKKEPTDKHVAEIERTISEAEKKDDHAAERFKHYEEQLFDSKTLTERDVEQTLRIARKDPVLLSEQLVVLESMGARAKKGITRADAVIAKATRKPTDEKRKERAKDTGIETMKAFVKGFREKKVYEAVKDAKTLKEFEEAYTKHHDLDNDLFTRKGMVMDGSKAAAVTPKHNDTFKMDEKYQQVKINYATFPKLPSFVGGEFTTHVEVVDKDGKPITMYGIDYLDEILKATKDFDMLWFVSKKRPIVGVNQRTHEKIILAPRAERRGWEPTESELKAQEEGRRARKAARERHLVLTHKREINPFSKVVYTRSHAIVSMPDNRGLKLSAKKATSIDDMDGLAKSRAKGVWSVPILDSLTDKEMYRYAFNVVFNDDGRSWEQMAGFVGYQKTARSDPIGEEDWRIKNYQRDAEIVTAKFESKRDNPLKFTEAKDYGYGKEKWLKTKHAGKTVYVRKEHIDNTRAVFGNDTDFYWNKKPKSTMIVADSNDSDAQIHIATRQS